ncbi:MAG: hypothetical protein J0M20_08325 [Burkholderiales bacterium]|nr:hypothetical protein [Burkholderiales bacterium]
MTASRHLITRLVAAALALGIAGPSLAAECKDITFTVKNDHYTGDEIKIQKIKYRDTTAAATGTENVVDYTCPHGSTCVSVGRDLGGLLDPRLGHDLSNVQFYYSYREADGDWSTPVWSKKFKPTDKECTNGRNYGTSAWVITG